MQILLLTGQANKYDLSHCENYVGLSFVLSAKFVVFRVLSSRLHAVYLIIPKCFSSLGLCRL